MSYLEYEGMKYILLVMDKIALSICASEKGHNITATFYEILIPTCNVQYYEKADKLFANKLCMN